MKCPMAATRQPLGIFQTKKNTGSTRLVNLKRHSGALYLKSATFDE